MKKSLFILILLCTFIVCPAATPPDGPRNLVRAGWGDMMFEALAFHSGSGRSDFGYTGHIFADYQYRFTKVVSAGAQVDFQGIFWTEDAARSRNYDLTILPTVRFTWFDREHVKLYSGVGAGLLMAFDNGGQFKAAPALNLNFIGVQAGTEHWGGFFDLGFLSALTNPNAVYLMGARILSAGVYYSW